MTRYALLLLTMLLANAIYAQDPSVTPPDPAVQAAPQPPPPMPDTVVGWVDKGIKAAPPVLGFLTMLGMMYLRIKHPEAISKIPPEYLPLATAVIAAVASGGVAVGTETIHPAGGVNWDVAMGEGGATGAGTHVLADKLIKQAVSAPPKVVEALKTGETVVPKGKG